MRSFRGVSQQFSFLMKSIMW